MALVRKDLKLTSNRNLSLVSKSTSSSSEEQIKKLQLLAKEGKKLVKLHLPNNNYNLIESVLEPHETIQQAINKALLKLYFERSEKKFCVWRRMGAL